MLIRPGDNMGMSAGFKNFRELVTGKKSFRVPKFQRNYSWEKENQRDLWRDLENIGVGHFFGTIILEENENDGVYDIVDGQQRVTTVLILLNELARGVKREGSDRAEEIRDYYIAGPAGRYKLELMGDDGGFFKDYLEISLEKSTDSVFSQLDPSSPSQKRLRNAIDYFSKRISREREKISKGESKFESFLDYCEDLQKRIESLELMVYPVKSGKRAVQVFSITNDRGIGLTDLEKTKSFLMEQLFSYGDEETLKEKIQFVQRKFQEMYEYLDWINDEELVPNFREDQIQRFHFILWDKKWTGSYEKRYYQRHLEELKKRFREMEEGNEEIIPQRVIDYTKDLWRSFLDMYRLLLRKKEDTKIDSDVEAKLERLLAIGRLGNFYPLLITSYQKFEEGKFTKGEFLKILDRIETFIFRVYSVKQRPAHTARISFYKLARKIHHDGVSAQQTLDGIGADTVISKLEEEIHNRCDDKTLREILEKENLFGHYGSARKDELRYLLYFYESSLEEEGYEGLNPPLLLFVKNKWQEKPSGEEVTIEHIWPQNTDRLNLTEKKKKEHEECVNKLGNLAYMTGPWNKEQQNQSVPNKLDPYRKSKIRMLNAVAETVEEEGWGKKQILNREEKMIDRILQIWPDPKSD
ncbi:hypothetical protein AKJ45_01960 [candidate division MSBL1 archaeon SCGC-AAA261F19]|uniref:DUF262 domain-containing protein n=1 Tax=candidate division MSBL1 archaeon SCGC-AAA261F19 TaxID=1698275 RepID=A0A133VA30_9EURY|nr:hypothetical protein AKJ45_01960 [candidate division MSBL1 archaeon SCGC-AAA261F19]